MPPIVVAGPANWTDTCRPFCGSDGYVDSIGQCGHFTPTWGGGLGWVSYAQSCDLPRGTYELKAIDHQSSYVSVPIALVDLSARWIQAYGQLCAPQWPYSREFCIAIDSSSYPYVQSVQWYLSGSSTPVATTPGHPDTLQYCQRLAFPGPGTYTVTVRVEWDPDQVFCPACCQQSGPSVRSGSGTCGECRTHTLTQTVVVVPCACQIDILSGAACAGQSVLLSVSAPNLLDTAAVYFSPNWPTIPVFPGGMLLPGGTLSLSHMYSVPGTYMATALLITTTGDTLICTRTVQVEPQPVFSIQGPASMCWNSALVSCGVFAQPLGSTMAEYCISPYQPGDSVRWQVSCSGRTGVQYTTQGPGLVVWDWGSGQGSCTICATVLRAGCSSTRCVTIQDDREALGYRIKGPAVTCADTLGGAIYSLVDNQGQPVTLPSGAQVQWLCPPGATCIPIPPVSVSVNWGSIRNQGGTLQAIVSGMPGCVDTFAYEVVPCCDLPAPVYRNRRVRDILRQDPTAFTCKQFQIVDTLYVDTSITWQNCHVVVAKGGVIWVAPRVHLKLITQAPSCSANGPGATRIEDCGYRWKGIYLQQPQSEIFVQGYKSGAAWWPVWVIGADTAIWAAPDWCCWQVSYGFFNRNGVGLYRRGLEGSSCLKLTHGYFTYASHPDLGSWDSPTWEIYPDRRANWPSTLSEITPNAREAVVGILLEGAFTRYPFEWYNGKGNIYFRHLHYGLVGQNVSLHLEEGHFEKIEEVACLIRENDMTAKTSLLDKVQIVPCPVPFRCPTGTGVCSEAFSGLSDTSRGREKVALIRLQGDSVSYPVYIEAAMKKGVREDRMLRQVTVRESGFREGKAGITLWQVGATPVSWDIRVQIERNSLHRYLDGIMLQVGRIRGTVSQNELRYGRDTTGGGRAGLYVGGRYSYNDQGLLTLSDNTIEDYRWGIRYIEAAGPVDFLNNAIVSPARRCGVMGISVVPRGLQPVRIFGNQLRRRVGSLACHDEKACSMGWPAAIEVEFSSVLSPVDVRKNTALQYSHSYRFIADPSLRSVGWWCNTSLPENSRGQQIDLFLEGNGLVVGDPRCAWGGNRFIGSPQNKLRPGSPIRSAFNYELHAPLLPSPPDPNCFPSPMQLSPGGSCRIQCGPLPPPPPPLDTAVLTQAVRQGGGVAEVWPVYRSLEEDTTGTLARVDSVVWAFYQWGQQRPLGNAERGYRSWWRQRTPMGSLAGSSWASLAEGAAEVTFPLVEKVMAGIALTGAEADTLVALSRACPGVYGPAVYAARWAAEALGANYDYDEACEEGGSIEARRWMPPAPTTPPQLPHILPTPEEKPLFLRAFPNPAELVVLIEWEGDSAGEVTIYDSQGKAWQKWAAESTGSCRLVVADWPRGVYKVVYQTRTQIKTLTLGLY